MLPMFLPIDGKKGETKKETVSALSDPVPSRLLPKAGQTTALRIVPTSGFADSSQTPSVEAVPKVWNRLEISRIQTRVGALVPEMSPERDRLRVPPRKMFFLRALPEIGAETLGLRSFDLSPMLQSTKDQEVGCIAQPLFLFPNKSYTLTCMKILAIETSCDETAAAVIQDGKILSNIIASQVDIHKKFGGVVPEVAAREHVAAIIPTIGLAVKDAGTEIGQIDYIAVTQGPGLATSLMVGIDTAKALGLALNKPVIPINHMEGHIYAAFGKQNIRFPVIALIVSGGHTMLVEMKKHATYRVLGETVDDAAGEAFDKTAKMMGLPYPGGPHLSKLAEDGNPQAYDFPRPMINSGNFQFSFSGLKTSVLYKLMKQKSWTTKQKANIAASVQQAIVDVLIAKLEKAILSYSAKGGSSSGGKPKTIILGGGVAANKLLRQRFQVLASKFQVQSSIPDFEYCTDNAAMIGLAAFYRIKNRKAKFIETFSTQPNLELK